MAGREQTKATRPVPASSKVPYGDERLEKTTKIAMAASASDEYCLNSLE